MTLYEVLEKIAPEEFPLRCINNIEIDIEPQTIFNVVLCFGSEENQWVKVDIQNPILAPWYECKVLSFAPSTDGGGNLEVWLDWERFIMTECEDYLEFVRRDLFNEKDVHQD